MKSIRILGFAMLILWVSAGLLIAGGQAEQDPDEPVEVSVMGYGGQDPAIKARLIDEVIGDRLAEQGIEIVYEPIEDDYNTALFNALSAGTAGDVVYVPVETAPGIIDTGLIEPLDDHIDPSPYIDSLVESYTFNGQVYGIAKDFNTLGMFYNKDLFDEAGVDYPEQDTTWDELEEMIRAVDDIDEEVHGAAFPAQFERFGAFAFANGFEIADDGSADLLDPALVEAVEWYTGMVTDGVAVQPSDLGQDWGGGAFGTGNVGIAFEGAWLLGYLRDAAPNLEFGTTFIPQAPTGESGNFLYTVAYGINTQTANMDAAIAVLEALTSPVAQQFVLEEGLAIPSREEMLTSDYFDQDNPEARANRVIFEGADHGNVNGFQFGEIGLDWLGPIDAALSEIMTGDVSAEAALEQAQSELDELLSR